MGVRRVKWAGRYAQRMRLRSARAISSWLLLMSDGACHVVRRAACRMPLVCCGGFGLVWLGVGSARDLLVAFHLAREAEVGQPHVALRVLSQCNRRLSCERYNSADPKASVYRHLQA